MQKLKTWLSSFKQPSISAPYNEKPFDTNIPSEDLIPALIKEHKLLINLFTDVIKLAENKRYDKAIQTLDMFRSTLTEHLITENTQLYLLLNAKLRNEPETFEKLTKLRREMTDITKSILDFSQQWRLQGLNENSKSRFVNQALPLCDVLINRLHAEERELFPLYDLEENISQAC